MSLLFFDGFESYGISDVPKFWDSSTAVPGSTIETGRNGGNCIFKNNAYNDLYLRISKSIANTDYVIAGFAFKVTGNGNYGSDIEHLINIKETTGAQATIGVNLKNQHLQVAYAWGSLLTIVWTLDPLIQLDTWYYIEIKSIFHSSNGAIIIRLNEQEVLNQTGLDTISYDGSGVFSQFQIHVGKYCECYIDDFYLADSSGTENNDFLGDVRIDKVSPNGAGNYAQMTPSAGNNYECVDESAFDDSDYIEDATDGNKDSYSYANVPTDINDLAIFGVQLSNVSKRSGTADNRKLKGFLRTGGADYEETTAQSLAETFKNMTTVWENDPSDSNPWTQAKINACEFGVEVNT